MPHSDGRDNHFGRKAEVRDLYCPEFDALFDVRESVNAQAVNCMTSVGENQHMVVDHVILKQPIAQATIEYFILHQMPPRVIPTGFRWEKAAHE